MTGREKTAAGAAAVLTMGATGYSVWKLMGTGTLFWHISQPETGFMIRELLAVWLLLFLFFLIGEKTKGRWRGLSRCGILAVLLLFCWLHEILFPAVFTGIYTGYLILTGMWFARSFLRKRFDFCWNFLLGSAVTISVFCLMSLFRLGSINKLRLWVAASGCCLLVKFLRVWKAERRNRTGENDGCSQGADGSRNESGGKWDFVRIGHAAMSAAILTLVLLQAGRMNLAVDFDSIWYGVRSDVMLDRGTGIYEDLGTLGVVYTYSKGFETLCLPLSGLPSYSFVIAMNLWIAGMTLAAGYGAARACLERNQALWVPFLMAAVPAIMNMADTAKADLITVFCQILMLQGIFFYMKERRADGLIAGMAAFGLSLTFKPTALVYSTAIAGMAVLWMIREWLQGVRPENVGNKRIWLMLIPSAVSLAGIWGRTLKLVGVPVTSVFYGIFQKIGFQVNYPFYASGFPSAGSGRSFGGKLRFLASRLYGILLNPQGEDMGHVIIAWGTVLPFVWLVLWLLLGSLERGGAKHDREAESHTAAVRIRRFLMWLIVPLTFVNLVSLYSLSQIDGNYYMLYYVLTILAGVIWLNHISLNLRITAKTLLLPVWLSGAALCCVTNWAWALGNGGLHPVNRGYYPHIRMEQQKHAEKGSAAIWDILASNPKNKVIALGEHPAVLTFPCWVQSYVDVSGYWGNPEVVADAPSFLKYLQFADVDYLYMEKEYVDASVRIYQIVRALVETGWLYDVRDENGNLILSVRKAETGGVYEKPERTENKLPEAVSGQDEALENLKIFDERYIQHP